MTHTTPTTSSTAVVAVASSTAVRDLSELVAHVFLPPELPTHGRDIRDKELQILRLFTETIQEKKDLYPVTAQAFALWDGLQENLDPVPMSDTIRNLLPGETLPIYLGEQNCQLLLTALSSSEGGKEELVLSTFRASLPSEMITSAEGDYASVFPSGCVVIPRSQIVESRAFIRQLHDLDLVDLLESVSLAKKSGHHNVVEKRDVADPAFASKWIFGTLADGSTRTARQDEFPRLPKKIRDSVIWKEGCVMPFRRSGLWNTAKTTLALLLNREFGDAGNSLYKLVMIKFMLKLLCLSGGGSGLIDLPSSIKYDHRHMMAKIARRVKKLERSLQFSSSLSLSFLPELFSSVVDQASLVLKGTKDSLKKLLEHKMAKQKVEINLLNIKLWIHLTLKNSSFHELLHSQDNSLQGKMKKVGKILLPLPIVPPRHRDNSALFEIGALSSRIELGIVLYDFERNVNVWHRMIGSADGMYIAEVFQQYLKTGSEFYKNDPVGTSRFFLTLLKIIVLWDSVVVEKFPMLADHRPGVDLEIIKDLLVSSKNDLESVGGIEKYFSKRANNARYPSLIEEVIPSTSSFAHRFAVVNEQIQHYRGYILDWGKQKATAKIREVHEAREKCEKLEAEQRKLECEYIIDDWKRRHDPKCKKCRLSRQERGVSVSVYETPLPVGVEAQNAVLFDLMIPTQIAVLRDILWQFNVECGGACTTQELYGPWHDYNQIRNFNVRERKWIVQMMSTKKLFLETHYKDLHPSSPDSDFVRAIGYNCVYSGNDLIYGGESKGGIKNKVTFRVEKKSRYSGMGWGLFGGVSQNEVIARQSECHVDLSLGEFVQFGGLRAEEKLQWRNLFRAFSSSSLSLKEESVYSLISQMIWEAGEGGKPGSFLRIHQRDFECKGFAEEWLGLLEGIRERHVDNWKDHYVLLTVIFVTQMVCVLNKNVEELAHALLDKCRKDAVKWSKEIQRIISTLSSAPRAEVDALRVNQIEANVCIALSFRVDELHLYELICSGEFIHWLLAVGRIHDNRILLGEYKLKHALVCLLRRVDELGVVLEPFIAEGIRSGDLLTRFVKQHHAGSSLWGVETLEWAQYPEEQQVYFCEIQNTIGDITTVQMDVLKGRFLVDGCPIGYLPRSIEDHKDFKRVFGGKSFEVQPFAFQVGRMITRDTYGASTYSFYLDSKGELTITEHREGNEGTQIKLELVSDCRFDGNLPWLLVEDYSHWYNAKKNLFEFFKNDEKLNGKARYVLEMTDWNGDSRLLMDCLNRRKVAVDVNCSGYKTISEVFRRLESERYLSMWCIRGDMFEYLVDIPRMGLQFSIRNVTDHYGRSGVRKFKLGDLVSKEYRGMRVSLQKQGDFGTLVGLKSGLLLEDANLRSTAKINSILLVPHGTLKMREDGSLSINKSEIRTPPFFGYEFDIKLRQLRAGESRAGWVWLAYLHAATCQGVADDFTGVTGVERALEILQSGVCFSGEPMDEESFKTLGMIKELAPVRRYYPASMKQMETYERPPWKVGGRGMDAFLLVVDKLIEDSLRLTFLHPEIQFHKYYVPREEEEFPRERELAVRAYFRSHVMTPEGGRLVGEYLPMIPLTEEFFENRGGGGELDEKFQGVMEMSQSVHKWTAVRPRKTKELLKTLLLNGKDLKGVFMDEGFPIKEGLYTWGRLEFREYFLDLYNLARRVRRKELRAEWAFLLSYLAFRKENVGIDYLRLLQVVAVHSEKFSKIDPPSYSEYSLTDEVYCKDKIREILFRSRRTWESYLDRNVSEIKEWESELQFADRLKPIHEDLVKEQCDKAVELIDEHWNSVGYEVEGNEEKLGYLTSEILPEIELNGACIELNIKLKNWWRNKHLVEFISNVELIVEEIMGPGGVKSGKTKDVRKAFNKDYMKKELRALCDRPMFTIDLLDIIGEKSFRMSDSATYEEAKMIYEVGFTPFSQECKKSRPSTGSMPDFPLQIHDSCPVIKDYMKDLEDSWTICHQTQERKPDQKKYNYWTDELRKHKLRAAEYYQLIRSQFLPVGKDSLDGTSSCLVSSELYPRILPMTMLRLLLDGGAQEGEYFKYLQTLIGAFGVLTTLEQRAARCVRYNQGKRADVELNSELNNPGHENWCPALRPEWLLFEIEMDIMIRPIQAKVAERMENPLGRKSALMQLNMGEGKSFCVVPLLCLSLANGDNLCRVTVLKSLYQMNRTSLSCKIGGVLLNRRVYSFPCRRDYRIGVRECEVMMEVYEECVRLGGIVMTLPEYRLSFELKAYERTHVRNFSEAREIFKLQEWLKGKARDVLDESDEILAVKYQLIYTLGKQIPVGGGCLRWNVIMQLLQLVPEEVRKFNEGFVGQGMVEYNHKGDGRFPHCRVLKRKEMGEDFCRNIALEILEGCSPVKLPEIVGGLNVKKQVLDFLLQEQLDRDGLNVVLKMFDVESVQETLLILRGLLACGVLVGSLCKRWRVNYGVNTAAQGYRRMAVPFRAKDVASEKVEFGHPDVGIVLTLLSYYYSGLSDEQLEHVFVILYLEPNPSEEYRKWVDLLPKDYPGREKIASLSSVNLNDFFQKTELLFPSLKYNVNVINFWLGRVVFPQESKQFGWKIGCSPWDLCATSQITTGFSGTNDSKILLPKTIEQRDLDELKGTNGSVLRNLLLPENNGYEVLDACVSGVDILKKLVDSNIRVLLDVGALMLELDNGQVARKWLKLLDDKQIQVDAAVYFEEDKLVVVTKGVEGVVPFELSTFRNRLDRCVIYLDDVHTRGTDLKIPTGNIACVTLGVGVSKDKLVQGCMRMRKLGVGHKIVMWSSREVDFKIRENLLNKQETIGTREVLLWTIRNNQEQVKEGFIHWASAGVYQAQKLSSLAIYKSSLGAEQDLVVLAENCSQKEQIDLRAMYGDVRTVHKFPVIVGHLLKRVNREIGKLIKKKSGLAIDCEAIVEYFGKSVVAHSEKYVGDLLRSTQLLDEEQERELEHELEAQHEKQLPARAKPRQNESSDGVRNFILQGLLQGIEIWGLKLPLVLKNTRIWPLYPDDGWGKNVYASKDFSEVVLNNGGGKTDEYLRPVQWFVSVRLGDKDVILLLSGFEVEMYLDLFRTGRSRGVLHMYSATLGEDQESLHLNSNLVLPRRINRGGGDAVVEVDLDWRLSAALKVFSGGVYFSSKEDQEWYVKWVGFCPRPRGKEDEEVASKGGLKDGWVKKEFWKQVGVEGVFKDNPHGLIRAIAICRNGGLFSMDSHVGKVVFGGKRALL